MNKYSQQGKYALLAVAALALSACGGGGGSSTPTSNIVTVSPSLGKFSAGAHVFLKKPNGDSIASGDTTSAGTASLDVGGYTGPLVIEVTGGSSVKYYDEGSKTLQDFDANAKLTAIAPSVQSSVGVTAATHAAVEAIKNNTLDGKIPPSITPSAIGDANAKIATALGISNVLQAPKLVDASTGTTLDLANVADKYALQLASLAKLATSGKTALDVAKDLAKDLSDDKLDGQVNGVAIPDRSTTYTATSVSDDLSTNVKSASDDLGTTETKKLVNSDSTVVGTVTTDVTAVVAPSPAVLLAKAMFAELRSTLRSLSNSSKTGFLDTQAVRASDDMKLVVAPAGDKLSNRLGLIGMAVATFEYAQPGAAGSGNLVSDTGPVPEDPTAPVWTNQHGNLNDVLAGRNGTQYCYIARPALSSSPVTCLTAGVDSVDRSTTPPTVKFIKIVLTPTAASQYSYIATRENRTWNTSTSVLGSPQLVTVAACGTNCAGTLSKTGTSSLVFSGTLPPSTPTTNADTIALSVVKTALSAASNFRYAVSGLVSTTSTAATPKLVSLSLDTGSYFDVDETTAATTGAKPVGFNLVGTAKTDATKLVGTIAISGITKDKSGTSTLASSVVFNGVISDTSTAGAGDILTGKLEASTTAYADYDATAALSTGNYIHGTASFTGTVQAPSRPLLKLVLSGTSTGATSRSATLNYSYGTVSITGSGTSTATTSSFSISNQDGIQIAANPDNADENLITKAGVKLGAFVNGVINYVDGTRESFN
jgi:hypothetical protein